MQKAKAGRGKPGPDDALPDARAGEAGATAKSESDWIGRQLRRIYDDSAAEPLPDDLQALLDRIDAAPARGKPE